MSGATTHAPEGPLQNARRPDPPVPAAADARVERLAQYARWLDASIGIPGTSFKVGVDPLIGLVPVLGDFAGVALSSWIVWNAWRLGARRRTLAKMVAYLALEATVGAIPFAGDLFDAWLHANLRNVELLRRDLERAPRR